MQIVKTDNGQISLRVGKQFGTFAIKIFLGCVMSEPYDLTFAVDYRYAFAEGDDYIHLVESVCYL